MTSCAQVGVVGRCCCEAVALRSWNAIELLACRKADPPARLIGTQAERVLLQRRGAQALAAYHEALRSPCGLAIRLLALACRWMELEMAGAEAGPASQGDFTASPSSSRLCSWGARNANGFGSLLGEDFELFCFAKLTRRAGRNPAGACRGLSQDRIGAAVAVTGEQIGRGDPPATGFPGLAPRRGGPLPAG